MNIMKVEIEVVETEGNCLAVWLWTLVTWEPLEKKKVKQVYEVTNKIECCQPYQPGAPAVCG